MTGSASGSAAQRERRRRILDTTIALAVQGGYDAVQMRAVAEGSDVALGTLYRYFPSKVHLLVSALAREFEYAERQVRGHSVPGDTPHQRVMHVLGRLTSGLQEQPRLAEALTRAFMSADATVKDEIEVVALLLTSMISRAIGAHPEAETPDAEELAIAKVIGDVWLAALVGWVTGRSTSAEVLESIDSAVRLLLR